MKSFKRLALILGLVCLCMPLFSVDILGSWVSGTSHTKESGTERALVFTIHAEDDNADMNVTSVTYGGQSMTKVIEQNEGTGYRAFACAYILGESGVAAASSSTFAVTWASSPSRSAGYSSVFLGGVDQSGLTGAEAGAGTSSSATVTTASLSTTSGDIVIVAGTNGNTGTYTVNNSFTEALEVTVESGDGVAGYKAATGANETPSITHSRYNRQAIIGFVVNDSGGATQPPTPTPTPTPTPGGEYNIAPDATSSTSYCSSWETIDAINDEVEPNDSSGTNPSGIDRYGNWDQTGTQWVEYQWGSSVDIHKSAVYWFDDNQGIDLPSAGRLLYWNGSSYVNFATVGTADHQYNVNTFSTISTTRIRLEMDSNGTYSTGVLEWQVYSGDAGPTPSPTPTPGPTTAPPTTAPPTTAPPTTAPPTSTPPPLPSGYLSRVFIDDDFKINSTFWNDRVKNIITNWIPHCYNTLSNTSLAEGGINNFIQARRKNDGLSYSGHTGYWFSPAYLLNTVESMCIARMVDPQGDSAISNAQSAMLSKINSWMPEIIGAQESDGYFATWHTLGGVSRWNTGDRDAHEGYVAGYYVEAGIAHYLMTGKTDATLYNAAIDLADRWVSSCPSSWWDGHQEMELALTRLGNFVNMEGGNGDVYINRAKQLMDVRNGGSQYDQSHTYPVNQTEAVGHAVRAVYLYTGMADVAMYTGSSSYTSAANALWDNLINRKCYVTGGVGSGESSEGFGANYSLPNTSYCESCSSCGFLFFNHSLNRRYMDAKYADLMETTLYNAILGSLDLNANNYGYTNPLDQDWSRYSWNGCPCCIGNIPRTLLSLPTWTYARASDAIFVNLFIGSTVTVKSVGGTNVEMVQTTNYPWEGNVSIEVNPSSSASFSVYIRVPDRSVSTLYSSNPAANGITSIELNGSPISPSTSNGYAVINRTWSAGDTIDFVLPMVIQRVTAVPQVTADVNKVALRYGPLVYNIESADLGGDTALEDYILDPSTNLSSSWNGSLLGGVRVITGTFENSATMNAIPNYARNNRGGRSIVWIREESVPVISPIADAATPSASYTSGWEDVNGINDQLVPANSSDRAGPIWGCWPEEGQQWIQYNFDQSYNISRSDIYWFTDGGGLMPPSSWYLSYWTGSSWQQVSGASGYGTSLDQWNTTTFNNVTTSRVRATINSGSASPAVVEWQIH